MAEQFARCLPKLLKSEGANDDDPDDPGGRTSRGITQREWDAFRLMHPGRPADVWKASQKDIREIYRLSYWQPWCAQLAPGVDYVFFDVHVLQGFGRAAKFLQRALRIKPDGHIGIVTLSALAVAEPNDVIARMSAYRRAHFRRLGKNQKLAKFEKGWLARADRVERDALVMATTS